MIEVIDCRAIADEWLDEIKAKIKAKGLSPRLTIVSLGEPDKASEVYIRNKLKACERVGIDYDHTIVPDGAKRMDVFDMILRKSDSRYTDGFIIQSPSNLDYISIEEIRYMLPTETDVDCFSFENMGKLRAGEEVFYPATVGGIVHLLRKLNVNVEGKNAVVIGRSSIVGKPMADVLTNMNATVTLCHSRTPEYALNKALMSADIIISATGKRDIVTPDMVNSRALIIDVGINRDDNGKLCGDCSGIDRWNDYWTWGNDIKITPVPNGVGRLTVAGLMRNILKAAEMKI